MRQITRLFERFWENSLNFWSQETSILFSIIAAIIHIGDIDFMEDFSDRHMAANSKVSNYQQLKISKYCRGTEIHINSG